MKHIDLSNPDLFNEIYIPLLKDEKRIKILYGGRNSGKSDFVAQAQIINLLSQEFYRLLLVRGHYVSIESSQFQTIKDYINIWGLNEYFHITTRPLKIVVKHNPNNLIIARGLDRPDNTKSIKDINAVWIEEATQISKEAYIETATSLRSSYAKKFEEWLTFNPVKEKSFLNNMFFPNKHEYEKPDGNFHYVRSVRNDTVILHTNYKDNKFLSKAQINHLEQFKDSDVHYYNVNVLGLWGASLKGLIYPDYEIINEMPDSGIDIYGLDYGYTNPTAFVHIKYNNNGVFVNELLYKRGLTHNDIIRIIKSDFRELLRKDTIVIDSAAPELIFELQKAGINAIPSYKGQNSVFEGINTLKSMNIYITQKSENIISEMESYAWQENNMGGLNDVPVKKNDHACDAIRYAIYTYKKNNWLSNGLCLDNNHYGASSKLRLNKSLWAMSQAFHRL